MIHVVYIQVEFFHVALPKLYLYIGVNGMLAYIHYVQAIYI